MNAQAEQAGGDAAALREAFDRGFTQAAVEHRAGWREYVRVEAGGQGFALAVEGLAGLERAVGLVAVPSRHPALAGVAAVRGVVVPVFRAEVVLGLPQSAGGEAGALLALVEAEPARAEAGLLGLAFDALGGLFRASPEDVVGAGAADGYVAVEGGGMLPILDARELARRIVEAGTG